MRRVVHFIFVFVVTVFFIACGGGGGSTGETPLPLDPVTLNGVAVDNYIKDATVCIDTNKNNTCDVGEQNTTTNSNGSFTFTNVTPSDDMVIIAYNGRDADTNESFPYILKNLASNTSNNKVILSSLNTLITDYKLITNTTLENAKSKIASFIDSNDTVTLVADLVANKNTNPDEFVKSLTIFQMIDKINTSAYGTSTYQNSANSFQSLATTIKNTTNLKYDDANVTVTVNNTTVNSAVTNMKPVFMSSPTSLVNENQSSAIDIDATDDNTTLIYSINDTTNFDINSSTGVVTFKANKLPNYEDSTRPTHQYTFIVTVSDQTNDVNQTVTINILNVNDAPVATSTTFTTNEDESNSSVLPTATDVDSSTLTYSVVSNATHGTLVLEVNGSFTYTPNANYHGTDSFTYRVYDESLYSTTQTVNITVTSVNDVPVFTSSSTILVNENQLGAIDINATDVDGDNLEYNISGTDAGYFTINSSGVVAFKNTLTAPDYETKTSYTFIVSVTDGNAPIEQNITIGINNLNDNIPLIFGGDSIAVTVDENQLGAIDINASDLDGNNTLVYGISGTDAGYFTINSSGVVAFKTFPNYEDSTRPSHQYTFIVTVNDGVRTIPQTITISINNVNESTPVFTSGATATVSVNEKQISAITLSASDLDGNNTLVYGISGIDASYFNLNSSSGVVTFKSDQLPDYESSKKSYIFTATVSDGENNVTQNVTINVNNINDNTPMFTSDNNITVDENNITATTLSATDLDPDTLTYYISGTDASYFNLNSFSGVVTFKSDQLPDYESSKKSYTFYATVNDGQNSASPQVVTINIGNLNDNAPVFTSSSTPSVDENQTQSMIVSATDADNLGSLTYSISDGNASLFDINSSTGVVTFKNAEIDNDYEKAHFYIFKVTASDGTLSTEQNITLSINSINLNAPRFTSLSTVTINENQLSVVDINATDVDSPDLNYTISAGTNAELFDINISTGMVTFKDINDSDYEKAHSYTFTVSVTDGIYIASQNLIININNLNDNAPVFNQDNNVTIAENQLSVIDDLHVTDEDGNLTTLTYSISDGNASLFDINSSTGKITFKDINNSDYEKVQNYTFTVTVGDGEHNATQDINITISNLNDNLPVFNFDNNVTVNENNITAITLTATDLDDNNLTFSIVESVNDANSFDINDSTGVVTFTVTPDYELGKTSYSFTARVNDGTHNVDQNVTININNLNDNSPVFDSNTTQSVDENNASAFITLSATDADNLSPVTYSISGGDSIYFTTDSSTGVVTFGFTPDYETESSYTFTATASDGENNTTQIVTININNLDEVTNDSPTNLILSANTIFENNEINVTIGTLSSEDNDSASFTYNLVGGAGATDNGLFTIVGNELKISTVTNYETKSSYNIRLQTKDDQNATFEKEFIIYINNVNEVPAITTDNYGSYDQSTNFITGVLDVNDSDVGDTHRFTIQSAPSFASLSIDSNTGVLSGLAGDHYVGINTLTIRVTDQNGTGLSSDKNISLTIDEVNDTPTSGNLISDTANTLVDGNLTIAPSQIVVVTIPTITDGDEYLTQTVTLTDFDNNNTEDINATVTDSDSSDGNMKISFRYIKAGQATVTFKLADTYNGVIKEKSFTLNVIARGSGWDLYKEQNASGYDINTTTYDGIVYDWNATKKWYESTNTILLPIKNITNSAYLGVDLNISNSGHYSMNKNKIIAESTVYPSKSTDIAYAHETKKFVTADEITTILSQDNKFAYDGYNKFFVSRVLIDSSNLKSYNDNPSNYCSTNYGTGWRLPTAIEMGNTQKTSEKYGQYIGAYVGDTTKVILTSSFETGSTTYVLGLELSNAYWDVYLKADQRYFRCVYQP